MDPITHNKIVSFVWSIADDILREYRTRLVADVVTGKVDVRDVATRLPDEAPLDAPEDDIDGIGEDEPLHEETDP